MRFDRVSRMHVNYVANLQQFTHQPLRLSIDRTRKRRSVVLRLAKMPIWCEILSEFGLFPAEGGGFLDERELFLKPFNPSPPRYWTGSCLERQKIVCLSFRQTTPEIDCVSKMFFVSCRFLNPEPFLCFKPFKLSPMTPFDDGFLTLQSA